MRILVSGAGYIARRDAVEHVECGRADWTDDARRQIVMRYKAEVTHAVTAKAGYDSAVDRNPAATMRDVWRIKVSGGYYAWQLG